MPRRPLAAIVVLALCLIAAALLWWRPPVIAGWQDRALDMLVRQDAAPENPSVSVIDIPRTDDTGAPWSRAASARLAARLAESQPQVIGWDVVFAGNCDTSAENFALAASFSRAPNVLGVLLSASGTGLPGASAAMGLTQDAAAHLWSAPGAEAPCAGFLSDSVTLASLSLPGDAEARVRLGPVAVRIGDSAVPSLPLELARLALGVSSPVIARTEDGLRLMMGALSVPLDDLASLRLRPRGAAERAARTLDAAAILSGEAVVPEGQILIVGSSVPQRGGLRPTSAGPLYPSVQIAADLTTDLLADAVPWRPGHAALIEAGALTLAGGILALALPGLAPLWGAALTLGLGAVLSGGAVAAYVLDGRLYDPMLPALALVAAATVALIAQAALTARAERALRQRMGQILPPVVVSRLAERPNLLRLSGERREITAFFTDLEGFTAATRSRDPEELIAALDRYFDTVCAVILRHGGMVDKIVGDAVHALFNAPLDQPGHVDHALAAAQEIIRETDSLREALQFGRTRIGIESGEAVLGDVGTASRIDYTAHGACVNLAARLEQAGKTLGPAVVIGPVAAALSRTPLRPLGRHEMRGFGPLDLFTLADG